VNSKEDQDDIEYEGSEVIVVGFIFPRARSN